MLNQGAALAEVILRESGVRDLVKTTVWSAHPASTVRIGGLLDKDCQTPIQGCYCMDASVMPAAWGLPPMVTIVAMAKRLAKHLTAPLETRVVGREPG
ncbi:MAG: GMC oxidoreductase [bacterium]